MGTTLNFLIQISIAHLLILQPNFTIDNSKEGPESLRSNIIKLRIKD